MKLRKDMVKLDEMTDEIHVYRAEIEGVKTAKGESTYG